MIQSILNLLKRITFKDIIYFIIIIGLVLLLNNSVNQSNINEKIYENNIIALNDTVSLYKTKAGELVATKTAFECDIKELKKINETLYTEIKDLKSKNDIVSGIYVDGEIVNSNNDTVYIIKYDTIQNGFNHNFNFNNKWRDLEGTVSYNNDSIKLNINKDLVRFDYTIGLDDKNKIYINSDNPYVKYSNISGFTIPKEKTKRIIIGPSITGGYSILHNRFDIIVGVSATLNLNK